MEYATRLFIGDTIRLDDGGDYSNAVFRDCDLEYYGGYARVEGALFFDCRMARKGAALHNDAVDRAVYRSHYLQGHRIATIDEDGDLTVS